MTGLSLEIANQRPIRPLAANSTQRRRWSGDARAWNTIVSIERSKVPNRGNGRDFPRTTREQRSTDPLKDDWSVNCGASADCKRNHADGRYARARSVFTFLYDTRFVAAIFDVVSLFKNRIHLISREQPIGDDGKRKMKEKKKNRDKKTAWTSRRYFQRRGAVAGNTRLCT